MAFTEYPKAMSHPQRCPAVLSRDTINRDGTINHAPPGQPERYPDVFVNNKDQELLYASKGYVPNGVSDPDAYMSSVLGADKPPSHEHVEFPKWLYQVDADGELVSRLLPDLTAQSSLVGPWYATPDDAQLAGPCSTERQLVAAAAANAKPSKPSTAAKAAARG